MPSPDAMMESMMNETRAAVAWQRVEERDGTADGTFVYAVRTTGIFCRPSCPSRRPARQNVEFFPNPITARAAGYRACLRCQPEGRKNDSEQVDRLCSHLAANLDRQVTLEELGQIAGVSKFTVQRMFVRVLGVSAAAYQRELRTSALKQSLSNRKGKNVTEAIYEAGYSSPSRVYEGAAQRLGMSPGAYRKQSRGGGQPQLIRFATVRSELGELLIAATDKGICAVTLGDSERQLEAKLRAQFPAALLSRDEALSKTARLVIDGQQAATSELNLDIRATAFQLRVWQALREIPRGQTRTYAQVAQSIGQPTAVRAVARACATNPVAVVVPCHRVIGSDGKLTGYRWGIERKKKLLESEKSIGGPDREAAYAAASR
jgi:AraC family transcriptional regulator of adaptative response/methylated-DNA-[protein]-cysteine methyltransferase